MRYSLAFLLGVVLASAIACTVLFATPDGLFYFVLRLVWFGATASVISAIVYRRGAAQAFAIGVACCAPLTLDYTWDPHKNNFRIWAGEIH